MGRVLLLSLSMLLAGSTASAQLNPDQMQWGPQPPGLPEGALLAVLSGDPGKPGLFTIRLRLPSGYKVMPHHHPTEELVTVIHGDASFGMGNKYSERHSTKVDHGGYIALPANMNHFAFTKDGAEIQITSQGPFQIIYVNARDDPRNNH